MTRRRAGEFAAAAALVLAAPLLAVPAVGAPASSAPAARASAVRGPVVDQHALTKRIKTYMKGRRGTASVAFLDLETGQSYTHRLGSKYSTASVVKVEVLAALLLKHQRAGTTITKKERSLASRMIRKSDNAATNVLWARIGGWNGLARSNKALGMISTTRPLRGGVWGTTQTTAKDQTRLLANLSRNSSVLKKPARDYLWSLMRTVVKSQRWGVPAAANRPATAALKNGWARQRADNGRWTTNSVGRVVIDGRTVVVAVLIRNSPSMAYGSRTSTGLATIVGSAVRSAR